MNLPHASSAQVSDKKIINYLLDSTNPQNKGKALFYQNIGYSLESFELLKNDLQNLARKGSVKEVFPNSQGIKYIVVGKIAAPNGKIYELKTVWIIEDKQEIPRLVTACPNNAMT